MMLAAITPYGSTVLAVVEVAAGSSPRTVALVGLTLGALVEGPARANGQALTWRIEPADLATFAADVLAACSARGVAALALDYPAGENVKATRTRAAADAIMRGAEGTGIRALLAPVGWRALAGVSGRAPSQDQALALAARTALLLAPEEPLTAADLARGAPEVWAPRGPVASVSSEPAELAPEAAPEPARGPAAADDGPAFAGCDPGSHELTLTVLRGSPDEPRFVVARTFPAASRRYTDASAARLAHDVVQVLLAHHVATLTIETPAAVYFPPTVPVQAAAAIASDLLRAARLDTALGLVATAHGIHVVRYSAGQARAARVGKRSPADAEISAHVAGRVAGWPVASTAHDRDAALVAIHGAANPAPEEPGEEPAKGEPKPKRRAKGEPKPKRVRAPRVERNTYREGAAVRKRAALAAERAAERAAAGCACEPGRKHRKGCPMHKPKGVST